MIDQDRICEGLIGEVKHFLLGLQWHLMWSLPSIHVIYIDKAIRIFHTRMCEGLLGVGGGWGGGMAPPTLPKGGLVPQLLLSWLSPKSSVKLSCVESWIVKTYIQTALLCTCDANFALSHVSLYILRTFRELAPPTSIIFLLHCCCLLRIVLLPNEPNFNTVMGVISYTLILVYNHSYSSEQALPLISQLRAIRSLVPALRHPFPESLRLRLG